MPIPQYILYPEVYTPNRIVPWDTCIINKHWASACGIKMKDNHEVLLAQPITNN